MSTSSLRKRFVIKTKEEVATLTKDITGISQEAF